MNQNLIRRQVASLEAQAFSLRDSLAAVPEDERAAHADDVARLRSVVAELCALAGETSDDGDHGPDMPEETSGAALAWTAERTTRLYAINTGLSVALTQAQAAHVVVDQALPALGANAGVILVVTEGATLKAIDVWDGERATPVEPFALTDPTPFAEAVRTAQSIWIETPDELHARYRRWGDTSWAETASLAVVPLIAEGRVLGVMAFRFDVARPFTISDRAFMLVLAQQCAAALERVHLYEQVRQAAALAERNRLARDLHDSVSQALYAIVLAVSVGRANLNKDLARVARVLDNIEALTGAAQADLRALLFDLRADSVSRTGLVNALLERAQFLRLRHNLAVRTELCEEPVLGQQCKEALYGIAREALHNAAKHARATQVEVKLARLAEGLALEVSDDGIGFEPGNIKQVRYGLESMRERAAELGAALSIESASGKGTRIEVFVPLMDDPGSPEPPPCGQTGRL